MSDSSNLKARFAPSPTGHLHIGGARSALFNWLLARGTGGKFVLRIEDTDIDRNIVGAENQIREDLEWLGLTPDESPWTGGPDGPYRQSECLPEYQKYTRQLLDGGHAYYTFDTTEELDAMRVAAREAGGTFRYVRPARFPSHEEAYAARGAGRPVVVRMKAPDHDMTVKDVILGDVTIKAEELEDFVIVKSNGWPTYHFAVVVDDQRMHITHVLRAQEHLMNTPKHQALQDALGFRRPIYAHMPLVMNIDGSKMSKRDKHKAVRTAVKQFIKQKQWTAADVATHASCAADAADRWLDKADAELTAEQLAALAIAANVQVPEIDVHDFRCAGYLPEAVLNFIALLGWSPGNDIERMSLDDMVRLFTVDRIGKTGARFDREKLLAFNTEYCANATPQRLLEAYRDYARLNDSPMAALDDVTLATALEACRGMRTFRDVDFKVGVLFAPDESITIEPDAEKKVLRKNEGRGISALQRLLPVLKEQADWSAEAGEALIHAFAEREGFKLGDVAQPLRVAVTGRPVSPGIGITLSLLGQQRACRRIEQCLTTMNATT